MAASNHSDTSTMLEERQRSEMKSVARSPSVANGQFDSTSVQNTPAKDDEVSRSEETLDLAGDLDLEYEAHREVGLHHHKDFDAEKGTSTAVGNPSPTPPSHAPATLAADDPENPRLWPRYKKVLVNFTLCIWVLSLTYSSTAYVASIPVIIRRFEVKQEVAILGVTLTVLGFAAGPLLFGPSSEIYGRRPVYLVTGLLYSAFSFGTAFSTNATSLLVFRFLLGFFGSASINNVPASVGDYTTPVERGVYTILYAICAFGGPTLGPLCSSFIERDAGWRWNLRVMAIFSTFMSVLVAFVPETHGPTLLKRKIKRAGNAPPPLPFNEVVTVYKIAMKRPLVYLFTEPIVALVSVYLSVLYGILYGFFQGFTVVWIETRGFSTTHYGLTYIALGLGFVIGAFCLATIAVAVYKRAAEKAKAEGKVTPPEARLVLAFPGSVLVPISLFLFAWTAPFPRIHWIVPCIAECMFGAGMLMIFTAFIPYLIESYLSSAASALASGMASRALIGSMFPLFALQMYHALSIQGASSLLAGISILLAPIPFIFRIYGPRIRASSRYAVASNL